MHPTTLVSTSTTLIQPIALTEHTESTIGVIPPPHTKALQTPHTESSIGAIEPPHLKNVQTEHIESSIGAIEPPHLLRAVQTEHTEQPIGTLVPPAPPKRAAAAEKVGRRGVVSVMRAAEKAV
ncbi:hypothetical protein SLS57_007539 [Botryosphaeria dothidea]